MLSVSGKLTNGLNSFERIRMSRLSVCSFFCGINGRFAYLSMTRWGSLNGLTCWESESVDWVVFRVLEPVGSC